VTISNLVKLLIGRKNRSGFFAQVGKLVGQPKNIARQPGGLPADLQPVHQSGNGHMYSPKPVFGIHDRARKLYYNIETRLVVSPGRALPVLMS
jgi:hypothetical protein